jgi:hypothetical protein
MSDDTFIPPPVPGEEVPTHKADDGHGVLFNISVHCNLCEQPIEFAIMDQIQARPPATHVVAICTKKCPCIDRLAAAEPSS